VIFFCWTCRYRSNPLPWPLPLHGPDGGMYKCPECPRSGGMQFVTYQDGVENDEALALIGDWAADRTVPPTGGPRGGGQSGGN
jgi:hypothetical protein